jgi:hypothetical protein
MQISLLASIPHAKRAALAGSHGTAREDSPVAGQDHTYSRAEVVAKGFEARCVAVDGRRYLWHRTQGIRFDPRGGITTLIIDPSALPEGPWLATDLGEKELATRA